MEKSKKEKKEKKEKKQKPPDGDTEEPPDGAAAEPPDGAAAEPEKKKKKKVNTLVNDIPAFKQVLESIHGLFDVKPKYYYLCSDLHLYQEGLIEIILDDGTNMSIKQYISGNGGTGLDSPLLQDGIMGGIDGGIEYQLEIEINKCGFLTCKIPPLDDATAEPIFAPIFVNRSEGGSHIGRRKQRRLRGSKKRKTRRNKRTQKRRTTKKRTIY